MEQARERVEEFVRRYWYEGNRVLLVLVVAVAVLLALLLVRRALRVISVVVVPALIGAVVVVWLLLSSLNAPDRAQTSVEWKVVRACGREFVAPTSPLAEDRAFVKRMELDCGIFGPKSSEDLRPYDGPY